MPQSQTPTPNPYLPRQSWVSNSSGVTPAKTLNSTASSAADSQATLAADNSPIRVFYGVQRPGAQLVNILPYGQYLVVQVNWGEGPLQSLDAFYLNDGSLPSGTAVTSYNVGSVVAGTIGNPANPDPTLVAAFAARGHTFTDTLPGIAYSVFQIPATALNGQPSLNARLHGRLVYDPRTLTTVWSDNPALCLADFITNTVYGMGRAINWASVAVVADACDALVSGEKRRTINLSLDTVQSVQDWVDTLRTYAGCWVATEANEVVLIPDRPAATVATFDHSLGQILKISPIKLRGASQTPTAIEIRYTNTSVIPWKDEGVWFTVAGPRRDSQVALPGIHSASQAYREAVERLKKLWLSDTSLELEVFDEALALQLGDVVEVTHPIGLLNKPYRILGIVGEYGRYKLSLVEYDPAVYSDSVSITPTYPDTNLPNPLAPDAPTGLTISEVLTLDQSGTRSSAVSATWDASPYTFVVGYLVEMTNSDGALVDSRTVPTTSYVSTNITAVKDDSVDGSEPTFEAYTVKVSTITNVGGVSPQAQASLVAQGKYLPPGPVPVGSFRGFEAGGTVYLSWGEALDIDDIKYRLKYGTTSQAYDQATSLDFVKALRYATNVVPVGIWRFWVESEDSVRKPSGTPRYVDVTVTLDNAAFIVDTYEHTNPTLTNVTEYAVDRYSGTRHFVTASGTWNSLFTGPLNGYTNPLLSYHNAVVSSFDGEAEDFGQVLGGDWRITGSVDTIFGTVVGKVLTKVASVDAWTDHGASTAKANGRYATTRFEAGATSTLHCTLPGQGVRLDAIPREEVFSGTTTASDPPLTITLTNPYVSVKKITLTPSGSTACSMTYDNVLPGTTTTFDVYAFDASGARVARAFTGSFQGV